MMEWEKLIITAIIALFPIVDPLGAIPTFLTITEGDSEHHRSKQLKKACYYVFFILGSFLIAGNILMKFLGISLPGIQIAGGIILFRVAQDMLQAHPKYTQSHEERTESVNKNDVSFTPLAMPMLSGPGAIAVTLGFTSLVKQWYDYIAILLAIAVVTFSSWLLLHTSLTVVKFLGITGVNIIERLMGFLILCVSVQFIINGILNIITNIPGG